jgi:hypothetical protein
VEAHVAVDASGTFSETKRQVGLLRMLQASVILSDYATLMVEILKDNARPEAGEVYGAMDMGCISAAAHLPIFLSATSRLRSSSELSSENTWHGAVINKVGADLVRSRAEQVALGS